MDKEQRTFQIKGLEIRQLADQEETPQITGYGAVFNSPANIGGMFTEVIAPGAFQKALSRQADVRALLITIGIMCLGGHAAEPCNSKKMTRV
ncbi:HK97 family phage prohead protease [Bacillus sonorensis]|nr:HK97 family phage prohead protease [Bacillus sonorensis]